MELAGQATFSEIVARYQKDIYLWALDLTGTREDAEDLAQETFIKVHRSMSRFRGDSKWSTWIFRIARNTYLDRLKTARHKMRVLETAMPENPDKQSHLMQLKPLHDPEQHILNDSLQKDLEHALNNLSQLQREVFVLRHYHGFKLREIGDILNRSEGTVKTTLFRAIQNLRAALSDHVAISPEVS